MKQTTYSTANIASVARMELRGIRGLWLATARQFRGISPDSADEAPKRRTKPPKDGGQVPAYALHPGYAGSVLLALVVDPHKSAWRSGLPLSQRGNEGDLATFTWVTVLEIPPNPPLEKGGIRAPISLTANADRVGYTDLHSGIHATFPLASRQAGAALITSLIFLTVLTILGMSTLGTALLESRMAGNARDRNLAFQAAEIGLRDAELYIRDSGRIADHNDIGYDIAGLGNCAAGVGGKKCAQTCEFGFCYNGSEWNKDGTNWIAAPVWENFWANAIQYQRAGATGKPVGVGSTQLAIDSAHVPLYVLPAGLPLVQRQPEYLIEGFEKRFDTHDYYRITVRGYGMRPGTRVMLQEVYTPN